MRRMWALLLWLLWPGAVWAQGAATLVADTVALNGQNQLIASGNVEVFFAGQKLMAAEITYDQQSDSLQITGPILLEAADGTVIAAQSAQLDPRLENGILQGARLVLDRQLQLAATQIDRREGRYAQLYKTAATSCAVCDGRPPLWEIRAQRVIHDDLDKQLYFQNASFHIRGVPVFWLPRLRLPDPSLTRATGLLAPEQRNTTQLGYGLKLPYFVVLGPSRDLTLTPYLSAETRTLELRYRQAFEDGEIEVNAAVSDDTLLSENRHYLFAEGRFDLTADYRLSFDIETVTDPAYLFDYGYADKDRLDSAVTLTRVDPDALQQARLTLYQTLRDDETNSSLPPLILDLRQEGRRPAQFGGSLSYGLDFDAAYRTSDTDGDPGRDVARAGAQGGWETHLITAPGLVLSTRTSARADLYLIADDSAYAPQSLRGTPATQATLRWPLARQDARGTAHLLEPALTLGWSDSFGDTPPNEDSLRTELDPGNLLRLSRYAGEDATETGAQAAAGLTWTAISTAGTATTLSAGQVLRAEPQPGFTSSSGLNGARSDWLLAGQYATAEGFLFDARSLWQAPDALSVADARIAWQNQALLLGANYIWQGADPTEGRTDTLSEWTVDAAYTLTEDWTLALDGRYDVAADRPVRAGIGLTWQNECVRIDVSASRRYTSSSTVEPTTTFGISGAIGSFNTGRKNNGQDASGCRT